jgi:hypothetical protein
LRRLVTQCAGRRNTVRSLSCRDTGNLSSARYHAPPRPTLWMAVTFILGLSFLTMEGSEFASMVAAGVLQRAGGTGGVTATAASIMVCTPADVSMQ